MRWTTVQGPKFEVVGTSNPELRTLTQNSKLRTQNFPATQHFFARRACRARLASLAHDSRASAVDRHCSRSTKACPDMKGRPPCDTIPQNENVNPHYSCRFVAKSLSRVARPARGAVRTRCVLVQYGEGPRGEPAGRRPVVAADRRLQQKCA